MLLYVPRLEFSVLQFHLFIRPCELFGWFTNNANINEIISNHLCCRATPEEGEDHGSRGGVNDGDGGDDGVHEQDTKEESGAKGVEAASWLSNRIENAREPRTGAVV